MTILACSSNITNNISQLIRYNGVKYQRRDIVTYVRHSSSNELPLPVAVGLMVYMRSRKKSLVNQLAHEDLSISYKRIKSIQRRINNQLCSKYLAGDIVCLPKLQTGLFTSAAIDNIDHNHSSATTTTSFHGTSITIFQHTDHSMQNVPVQYDMNNSMTTKTKLPSYYTDIEHSKGGKPEPPAVLMSEELCLDKENLNEAEEWLNILKNPFGQIEERASFSGFYSRHSSTKSFLSISQLLPILPESINTPATVRQCARIIVKLKEKLNPSQVPIIAADQPVYGLGKQVQGLNPHEFGNIIRMMFLNIIDTWLDGSG